MPFLFKKNKIKEHYYLHNALKFITEEKLDIAYEEICYTILKNGGVLSSEEKEKFIAIQEKRRKEEL